MIKTLQSALLGALVLAFGGCTTPGEVRSGAGLPLPEQFAGTTVHADFAGVAVQAPVEKMLSGHAEVAAGDWWRKFGNEELTALIERGLANNLDLRIATIQLAQASAAGEQVNAGRLPSLSLPVVAGVQAPGGTLGDVPANGGSGSQNSFQASLRGSWRPDLWGEQSAKEDSASLRVWRAAYSREEVLRNITATVAARYFEYVSLNDRLRVARELEDVLSETIPTIQKRLDAGDATLTELEQQKAAVFTLQATIPGLIQQKEEVLGALSGLVGAAPGTLVLSESGLQSLKMPDISPGIPSLLLLRRPDVRMAEARMLAANADLEAARARMFPAIDLSSQIGYSSIYLDKLLNPNALFWNVISGLTATIFDGGKLKAEISLSSSVHEEMVETYARTIYQSLREVENALSSIRLLAKKLRAQEEAANAARRAWEGSRKMYALGGIDHLALLDTERSYYRYLDDFHRGNMEYLRSYLVLFHALGSGDASGDSISLESEVGSSKRTRPAEKEQFVAEGIDVSVGDQSGADLGTTSAGVELIGLYHRDTIGPVWRDLRRRFPAAMSGKTLLPRIAGRIEGAQGKQSWYRVKLAGFTDDEADRFCRVLLKGLQRCKVSWAIGSNSSKPVVVSGADPARTSSSIQNAAQAAVAGESMSPVSQSNAQAEEPELRPIVALKMDEPVQREKELGETTEVPSREKAAELRDPPLALKRQDANVTDSELGKPAAAKSLLAAGYSVQFGVFAVSENASKYLNRWKSQGYSVYLSEIRASGGRTLFAVRAGEFTTKTGAASYAKTIEKKEGVQILVVKNIPGTPISTAAE